MGQIYASSDWHGCGAVAKKVLNYLKPDDTLYFLGDATDRGEDGIAILDALINRPNTFYIKGNHDQMFEDCIPYMIKDIEEIGCLEPERYPDSTWFGNCAWTTINNGLLDGTKEEIITRLQKYKKFFFNLPTELRYESPAGHLVILEHAGYTPFNISHKNHDPLWDRDHFYDIWGGYWNLEKYYPYNAKNTYLIHGHTPVQYLRLEYGYKDMEPLTKKELKYKFTWYKDKNYYIPKAIQYCSGHKIDIDMCTIISKRIALINLDTFEVKYFDEGE